MEINYFSASKVSSIAKAVIFTLGVSTLSACGGSDETKVADITPPVITLAAEANINLTVGDDYQDAGASATDDIDGAVSIVTSGSVDTATAGTYEIIYRAVDSAGNVATVTRTVIVSPPDLEAPVITLIGDAETNIFVGDVYEDAGATVTDDVDQNVSVTTTGTVDTSTEGTYTITYSAVDAAGRVADEVTRTVIVTIPPENNPPVITLIGESTITHLVGRPYREFGATATDIQDGDLTVGAPTGTVDETTAGTYTITYSVTDADANTTTLDRTVVIVEAADARPFKFTIDTSITGVTASTDFTLSSADAAYVYDFNVDWGDGNVENNLTDPAITHTYATAGTYTISVTGDFHRFYTPDIAKVVSIQQWGDIQWSSFTSTLENSGVLSEFPTDLPDLRASTGFQKVFKNSLFNHDVGLWNVGPATNFLSVFHGATEFNYDISKWDISAVTNLKWMFNGATNFNQDLSNWDFTAYTSGVGTFNNSGISVDNWDALIISMAEQATTLNKTGGRLQGGGLYHSSAAETAISTLVDTLGWTFVDNGLAPTP